MEWGGSRQEIEGAVRTAVGRGESREEKAYLDFYTWDPIPNLTSGLNFLNRQVIKSPVLHELWPLCLFGMSQRKAALCVRQPQGDAQWPRWGD